MLLNSLLKSKSERYSNKFGEVMIDLASHNFIFPLMQEGRRVSVSKDHIARPDIIAKYLLGDAMYGDLLCKINGISNPFELNEGDILAIPMIHQIDEFYRVDDYDNELDSEFADSTPVAKSRKEKRLPSDTIIGDTRFKIDPENRLIIY